MNHRVVGGKPQTSSNLNKGELLLLLVYIKGIGIITLKTQIELNNHVNLIDSLRRLCIKGKPSTVLTHLAQANQYFIYLSLLPSSESRLYFLLPKK